jgi:hypothetical protein
MHSFRIYVCKQNGNAVLFKFSLKIKSPSLKRTAGCRNAARMMIGVYFCKKHWLGMFVGALSNMLFHGRRRTRKWIEAIKQEYFSNSLPDTFPEPRKELPDARQNFARQSARDYRIAEKTRHAR